MELEGIKSLAQRNWRGVDILDLVATIQEVKDWLGLWTDTPDLASILAGWPIERKKAYQYYYACLLADIGRELERRRALPDRITHNPDQEIIQALKQAISVADVVENYTQVWCYGAERWKYRCTQHGEDKEPSGVIYIKEQRWHCFGCNKGGDVFDAVMGWERCDLGTAIAKLAKRCGLETRPLIEKVKKGGIML